MEYGINQPMRMGDRIAVLRKANKLSRKELAQAVKVTPATIANYENNKTTPDMNKIRDISVALGVTMNMIMHGCEPKDGSKPLFGAEQRV